MGSVKFISMHSIDDVGRNAEFRQWSAASASIIIIIDCVWGPPPPEPIASASSESSSVVRRANSVSLEDKLTGGLNRTGG